MRLADLEHWIFRDPAGRGFLAKIEPLQQPHGNDIRDAAIELTSQSPRVGIVTGFYVPDAPIPAAETDGPIGAILLANVLQAFGADVCIITDDLCLSALRAAVRAVGREVNLLACPIDPSSSHKWREEFWRSERGRQLTHLISIERVGPAILNEPGQSQCRNMRGLPIDNWSADLHRLFEDHPPGVRTIGIGDGGNEIGMGRYWQTHDEHNSLPANACRTQTDSTIVAGVSDWGAFALAAAIAMQHDNLDPLTFWTSARIENALVRMVVDGPAIDGCTFLSEPTVDGLPFATYLQPWDHFRRELGIAERIC